MKDNAVCVSAGRTSQVVTAMGSLEEAISQANELGVAIEDRLSRVLMPDAPAPISECEKTSDCGKIEELSTVVGLAKQLAQLEDGVRSVVSRLASVIGRCEL